MIIFRYLTREIFAALSAVTSILLLIFLSNQFVRYLNQAVSGKFAGSILLQLLAIEIPHLLSILLPLGLYLAILLSYSRLYAENEMTVLNACGFSRAKLIRFTLPTALIIATVVGILALWINPQILAYRDKLILQNGIAMTLQTALPGRFRASKDGKQVLYVEKLSSDRNKMENLFFAQLTKPTKAGEAAQWTITTAQEGFETTDPKTGAEYFVATNGRRYDGIPGQKNLELIQFKSYALHLGNQVVNLTTQQETFPTSELLQKTNDPNQKAILLTELEWRLSLPISVFLLTILAILLSYLHPRQNRYTMLLPAILIYAIYVNLLLFARNWVMGGAIPLWVGLWWIHALLLLIILLVWAHQFGWGRIKIIVSSLRVKRSNPDL